MNYNEGDNISDLSDMCEAISVMLINKEKPDICIYEDCKQKALYNYCHIHKPDFCHNHKMSNMIDKRICNYIRCAFHAIYNYPNQKHPVFCHGHKEVYMINIKKNK